jgi:hypothetical protein
VELLAPIYSVCVTPLSFDPGPLGCFCSRYSEVTSGRNLAEIYLNTLH